MFRRQADIEGGRTIYGREYISALQNRNKTNLVEILGSAPPIVEEIIPEDSESRNIKKQITKSIRRNLLVMSGLNRIPGGLQQIVQQSQNRFQSRVEFELQSLFLPLQGFTRDVLFEFESLTTQYQTGTAIGGFLGAAIGFYYLGPTGATIFGTIGGLVGAKFEKAITSGGNPLNPLEGSEFDFFNLMDDPDSLDPTGGLPDIDFIGSGGSYDPGSVYGSVLRMRRRLGNRIGERAIRDRNINRRLA